MTDQILETPVVTLDRGENDTKLRWRWRAVPQAVAYQVRVASKREDLDGATPEIVEDTVYQVPLDDLAPDFPKMHISVRACAGRRDSPETGEWSRPVSSLTLVDVFELKINIAINRERVAALKRWKKRLSKEIRRKERAVTKHTAWLND